MALLLGCPVAQLLVHLPALPVVIGDGVLLWPTSHGDDLLHLLQPNVHYLESHLGQGEAGEEAGGRVKVFSVLLISLGSFSTISSIPPQAEVLLRSLLLLLQPDVPGCGGVHLVTVEDDVSVFSSSGLRLVRGCRESRPSSPACSCPVRQ